MDTISEEDKDFKGDHDIFFYRSSLEVSEDEYIVKALKNAYVKEFGSQPVPMGMSGWLDSSIMAQTGMPTVIYGPAGHGLHADVEYVDFKSVVTVSKVLADTIIEFCGV